MTEPESTSEENAAKGAKMGKVPEGAWAPETTFEIMRNLEAIFKGAFLQDSEEEDAVEDENFITVEVKSRHHHKTYICFRKEILHLPSIKSIMGPKVGRPPKIRSLDGEPLPPQPRKKPRIFANWLECDRCDYKCRKKQTLQSHMLDIHNEIIYQCLHCEQMYKDKDLLNEHEKSEHGGIKYTCPELECNFTTNLICELEDHIRGTHLRFLETCKECENKSDNIGELNSHIQKEHEGGKLFCEYCVETVDSSEDLLEHINTKHPDSLTTTQCSKCDFETKITKLLKHHEEIFHKTNEYKCSQCDFLCNWEADLQSHYIKCHGAKDYECEYCDFTCQGKTIFNRHMRENHLEMGKLQQTQCPECGLQFPCRRDMKRHLKENHEKLIEFNCSYCGKNFPKKPNLKIHERIHTGEKPYKCDICGHAFTAASNLYHHKKKHMKESTHTKHKTEHKSSGSSVHAVYEQGYLPQGQSQSQTPSYRHDSSDSGLDQGGMEPKIEGQQQHHQESPHSKSESYPDSQYLANFNQYYGSSGYNNPSSYSYPSPGEQYDRQNSTSGGGGEPSGSEEGAPSNYRRLFTEEQYRMLAQEEEYRKRSFEEQYRKFSSSSSSSSIEEQYRKFATEEHYRKLATEEQYRRLASAAASKIDRGGLWMPALH